jgi:serine/threonine protein phosphatase PrpC
VILFSQRLAAVANVGRCRICLGRERRLTQVSADDGASGLDREDAPAISVSEVMSRPNDVWLLSTDCLHTALSEEVIASVLFDHESAMASRAQRIVDLAQTSDGADDVTVLAFQWQLSGDADARMAQMTSGVLEHSSGRARS